MLRGERQEAAGGGRRRGGESKCRIVTRYWWSCPVDRTLGVIRSWLEISMLPINFKRTPHFRLQSNIVYKEYEVIEGGPPSRQNEVYSKPQYASPQWTRNTWKSTPRKHHGVSWKLRFVSVRWFVELTDSFTLSIETATWKRLMNEQRPMNEHFIVVVRDHHNIKKELNSLTSTEGKFRRQNRSSRMTLL